MALIAAAEAATRWRGAYGGSPIVSTLPPWSRPAVRSRRFVTKLRADNPKVKSQSWTTDTIHVAKGGDIGVPNW
jgi:hypothetical protein